jgi:hypothetical protein
MISTKGKGPIMARKKRRAAAITAATAAAAATLVAIGRTDTGRKLLSPARREQAAGLARDLSKKARKRLRDRAKK